MTKEQEIAFVASMIAGYAGLFVAVAYPSYAIIWALPLIIAIVAAILNRKQQ